MVVDDLLVGLDGVSEVLFLVGADVAAVVALLRLVVAVHVQLGAAPRALEACPARDVVKSSKLYKCDMILINIDLIYIHTSSTLKKLIQGWA